MIRKSAAIFLIESLGRIGRVDKLYFAEKGVWPVNKAEQHKGWELIFFGWN
jgi:hypothetical protein